MHSAAAIRYTISSNAAGSLLLAVSSNGICALIPADNPESLVDELARLFPRTHLIENAPGLSTLLGQVTDYLQASDPANAMDVFDLDLRGTPFQSKVWQQLCSIPRGSTLSYTRLAQLIGNPRSVRAVASACAANKIALLIPCHRVIRADGTFSGYRWGIQRKRQLLQQEQR